MHTWKSLWALFFYLQQEGSNLSPKIIFILFYSNLQYVTWKYYAGTKWKYENIIKYGIGIKHENITYLVKK